MNTKEEKAPPKEARVLYRYDSPFDLLEIIMTYIDGYLLIQNQPLVCEETKDVDHMEKLKAQQQADFMINAKNEFLIMLRNEVDPKWKQRYSEWTDYEQDKFDQIKNYKSPELWISSEITRYNRMYSTVCGRIRKKNTATKEQALDLLKLCMKTEILKNLHEPCRDFEKMRRVLEEEEHKGALW